jgi:hypothetical protein
MRIVSVTEGNIVEVDAAPYLLERLSQAATTAVCLECHSELFLEVSSCGGRFDPD